MALCQLQAILRTQAPRCLWRHILLLRNQSSQEELGNVPTLSPSFILALLMKCSWSALGKNVYRSLRFSILENGRRQREKRVFNSTLTSYLCSKQGLKLCESAKFREAARFDFCIFCKATLLLLLIPPFSEGIIFPT